MHRLAPVLPFLLAACAGTGADPAREPAPDEERRELEQRAADQRRRDFQAVLVRLDQSIDSYVQALSNQGEARADRQIERLERTIREMVLDQGAVVAGRKPAVGDLGENYRRLQAAAADGSNKNQQAIALAALGFSGQMQLMPLILQGAQLDDPFLVDRAVLGLAVLRSPATPPGVLAAIAERQQHPEDGRVQAAWALHRIQQVVEDQGPILAIWRRWLGERRESMPLAVQVTAVRGLGYARQPEDAALVAPFLKHPTPRLRMAAAVAIARLNAQQYAPDLIALLGPQETTQNVRLHARKALADLAGGRDFGYDAAAWRKVFDRGPQ
ncbi:MAG: HEAT repeat domain-containing protein [Planctomycetes bacterium]|nr:HEAT repeat domain-containing protein [Planctomycetota bacterium]